MRLSKLADVMKEKRIRSEELAAMAMLGISTVKTAKSGKDVSDNTAKRIARAMKVKEEDLA